MGERRRLFLLVLIMTTVSLVVAGITIYVLYGTAFEQQRERLVEAAQSQARLIEAIARFDAARAQTNPDFYPGGPTVATLSQIIDAHGNYKGFGETGEFTLARRAGDDIFFLLRHRHFDLDQPKSVPLDSKLAEPMRRALSGFSGTVVGLDYRGETVLAAHEPVAELGFGIVAKIDLAEIRAPFIRAGLMAICAGLLVVFVGAVVFLRVSNPIMKRLEERTAELIMANEHLELEIQERKGAEEALSWEASMNAAIAELSSALILPKSIEDISWAVLEHAKQITRSDFGYVGFIDPDTGYLVSVTMTRDIWDTCNVPDKEIIFKKFCGLWGWVLDNRKPLLTNSPTQEPMSCGTPPGHIPINRFISVPALLGDSLVGQIALANSDRDYTEDDLTFIKRLATLYAIAIQRNQAEEKLQKAHTELEQRVEERTAELLQANEQLQREIDVRMRTEEEIRKAEEKYRLLVQNLPSVVYKGYEDWSVEFFDEKVESLMGYSADDFHAKKLKWSDLIIEEDLENVREAFVEALKTDNSYVREYRTKTRAGDILWIQDRGQIICHEDGMVDYVSGAFFDVTDRKMAEEALRESEKELRLLSGQLLTTQEQERGRIARELHDGIGQSLSAIKFRLEDALGQMGKDVAEASVSALNGLIPIIQSTVEEVRRITMDLRPSTLDDLGILATIGWFCREFQETYATVRIKKEIGLEEADIPESLKTVIFRVLQEALNNVAKHSGADSVTVFLTKKDDTIELAIEDNGRGFDLKEVLDIDGSKRGFGLGSMKERIELSGGSFSLESIRRGGTNIRASWQG
ncbi:MAG: GAF domain-containing protein [Syntrophobacterales bacterium]|jgi:PAS domain S-box-containing protein